MEDIMPEPRTKQRLTTRIDSVLLNAFRARAKAEGRSLQSLTEEALTMLIHKRRVPNGRPHVMAAYKSVERYGPLFEKLAKS